MRFTVHKLISLALLASLTGCGMSNGEPKTLCILDCLPKDRSIPRAPSAYALGKAEEIEGGGVNLVNGNHFVVENSSFGGGDQGVRASGSSFILQGGSNASN